MRIALCLSGQIRSFDLVKSSLMNNLINIYHCDVFCHFWHNNDNSKYINSNNPKCTVKYGEYNINNVLDVIKTLKPTSVLYEEPMHKENTKSMLCSIMKSVKLKKDYEIEHDFKYDAVIRARYDLRYNNQFYINPLQKDLVYVKNRPGGCGGINDWLAYGDSDSIDIYSNTFNAFEDTERIKEGCPEGILQQHLINNNVNIKILNSSFDIVREDGSLVK